LCANNPKKMNGCNIVLINRNNLNGYNTVLINPKMKITVLLP